MTEFFFHAGNNYQESLFDSKGNAYSKGCQTGGSYAGAKEKHNAFMKIAGTDFKGNYYLRAKPSVSANKCMMSLKDMSMQYLVPADVTSRIKIQTPLMFKK